MKIDPVAHRGYVLDAASITILVFDVAGKTLSPITSISTSLARMTGLDLDVQAHRLIVGDQRSSSIAIVDVDPSSASVNTVLKVIATGVDGASEVVALDGNVAWVADRAIATSVNVSRVNLTDGTSTNIVTTVGRKSMVVDPSTHTLFISSSKDNSVIAIAQDGTQRSMTLDDSPVSLAISGGKLLVRVSDSIRRFDERTFAVDGSSPVIPGLTAMTSDDTINAVFAASGNVVSILDAGSLIQTGSFPVTAAMSAIAVEPTSHKLFALEVYRVEMRTKIEMYGVSPTVSRVEGADRFEVSAAVSRGQFAAPAPVAYVASGGVFADALSASAAAGAEGGPVLLVQKDRIPDAIATELTRLRPARIVVLGGTATVDPSVETALKAYSGNVSRIGGADRFEVSAAVSQAVFGAARPVAYVAAGATFPDALSGSAAAGKLGGPVLLTAKDSVPASVEAELRRLAPAKIVVLGGPDSVSEAVLGTLTGIQANTTRLTGSDRFEVSSAVCASIWAPNPKVVYVASGLVYPDALSGSATAIANGAPVLLVSTDAIPPSVATELKRLKPTRIVILGGPNSVSPAVEQALQGYIA